MEDVMNNQDKQSVKAEDLRTSFVSSPINVLIVDDEAIIRTGLRKILNDQPLISVMGEASSGEEAEAMVNHQTPDVVLMDISMPGQGGIETTRSLIENHPNIKVLALSVHCDEHYPSQILKAGAQGYITKGVSSDELFEAIKSVNQGNEYICHAVSQKIRTKHLLGRDRLFDCLTDQQLVICSDLVIGEDTDTIAKKHNMTNLELENFKTAIFEKLNIKNEVSLIHLAIRNGLLDKDNQFIN